MMQFLKSQSTAALRRIPFRVVDETSLSPEDATGLTFSAAEIQISKNGAAVANSAGSVVEVGNGNYYYQATAGELDTLGFLAIYVDKSPYSGSQMVEVIDATNTVLGARVGPWTGDTAKNSIYGALRSMANSESDFTSADLTKDDGGGAGDYDNIDDSLKSIRAITAVGVVALDATTLDTNSGQTTTTVVLPSSASSVDEQYRDCELIVVTGANAGRSSPIKSYVGSTRTLTLPANRAMANACSSGDVLVIKIGTARSIYTDGIETTSISSGAGSLIAKLTNNNGRKLFVKAGTQSTLAVTPSGSDNNYKLTAWAAGTDGDSVTLTVVNPGTPSATLSVSVSTAAITVNLATDGSSTITTTANELVSAINNSVAASALVYAESTEIGTGVVTALSVTNLSSGAASTGSDSNDGLSPETPKATLGGAISAHTAGDIIHLGPGVHKLTGSTRLPNYVTIEGEGPQLTRIRLGVNTVDLFGTLHLNPSPNILIRDIYIDGALCGAGAVYTGTSATPPGRLHLENVHVRARGYGVWAAGGTTIGARIQKQVWTARNCRIKSGISAWAMQGSSTVRHETNISGCYLEADDKWLGGSESSDTSANTYALLIADSDGYVDDVTCNAIHHHKNRTAYSIQAGSPTDASRPGRILMTNVRCYSEHTQATSPVRITGVSAATEAVITSAAHGLANDNLIWIQGVNGTGAIVNVNRTCRVSDVTTDTFKPKDPQTGDYISTASGTYVDGGTWDFRAWDVLSKWTGSLIVAGTGCAFTPASVETYYGEFESREDNIEHKLGILQGSESGHISYASTRPFESLSRPYGRGWTARHGYSTIANAVLEATAGTPVYLSSPERPFEITAAVSLPDKIDVHGHKNKTKVIFTGSGGADTTGFFSVTARSLIEDIWLDDQTSGGVSGVVVPSGAGRVVLDHVVATIDFDGLHCSSSTASVATVENCRFVAGQHGAYFAGAAHLGYYVGEHPYVSGSTSGIYAAAGTKVKAAHGIITGTTDDLYATGSGTVIYATESNYDSTNTTEASSGQIYAYEQVADTILDSAIETNWSLRKIIRLVASLMFGKSSGYTSGSGTAVYRDIGDTKARVTGVVDSSGNRTSMTLDGD